jgi:SWI/SNF-related matrix-associated actin-dependent regulator of chromatin subfamily A member 5
MHDARKHDAYNMFRQDFQFFPPELAALQERELAVHKRLNGIAAAPREPQGPDDTPEKIEEDRIAAQEFIDNGKVLITGYDGRSDPLLFIAEPLTEEESALKDEYIEQGFPDWTRRDFQQFVKALEAYGWGQDFETYAAEIQDKDADEVEKYYEVFQKNWTTLPGVFSSLVRSIVLADGTPASRVPAYCRPHC